MSQRQSMAVDGNPEDSPPRRVGPFVLLSPLEAEPGLQLWTGILQGAGRLERKILIARAAGRSPVADALRREARLGLDHPHVLSVMELLEHEGETFLAYARTPGRTLKSVLDAVRRRYEHLPHHVALHIAARSFDALAFAHDRPEPLVHGALQPTMVWLGFDGTVRLRGFGQGPDSQDRQRPIATPPAPGYASPEQRGSRPLDERADSFGIGTLLFEMLTGRPPPREDVPSLDRVLTDISPRLVHCVRRATEPDRRQRMSCGELRDELDRIVHGEDPSFGRASVARWMDQILGPEAMAEQDRERILAETPDLGRFGPPSRQPHDAPTPPPPSQPSPRPTPSRANVPPPSAPPRPSAPPPPEPPPELMDSAPVEHRSRPDRRSAGAAPPPQPAPRPPPPSEDLAPPTTSPVGSDPLLPVEQRMPPKPPQTQSISRQGPPKLLVAALGAVLFLVIAVLVSPAVRRGARHAFIGRNPGATLVIESIPAGAEVTLDGYATGRKTPFMVENIESGIVHQIVLERPGSQAQTATVSLDADGKKTLNLHFPDAAVKAVVRSTPEDATLFIDGKKADLTPAELILVVGQETKLAIEQVGYVRWEKTVTPEPYQPIELDVQLEKTEELKAQEAMIEAAKRGR